MEKLKKLASQSIVLAICSINEDIKGEHSNPKKNKARAKAVKLLVDAFEKVNG